MPTLILRGLPGPRRVPVSISEETPKKVRRDDTDPVTIRVIFVELVNELT